MGVGASRLAYRCRVTDGCYKGYTEGSYCIYKVVKPDSIYDGLLDEVRTGIIQGQSFQKIQSDLDNRFEPVHVAPEFHSDGDLVISQEQMDALQAELALQCQLWNELTGVTAPKVE